MFGKLTGGVAVRAITAVTVIGLASVPLVGSSEATFGNSPVVTVVSRSGTHQTEVADTLWGQVRQSVENGAQNYPYDLGHIWPTKYTGAGA